MALEWSGQKGVTQGRHAEQRAVLAKGTAYPKPTEWRHVAQFVTAKSVPGAGRSIQGTAAGDPGHGGLEPEHEGT